MLESNIRYEVQKSPPASLLLLVRFVKLAISKLEIKSYRGVYIVTSPPPSLEGIESSCCRRKSSGEEGKRRGKNERGREEGRKGREWKEKGK